MSKVVNVKVKYIRPKYQNLRDWNEDENNIYIGRKGVVFIDGKRYPSENSIFCNPFKIDQNNDREKVLKKYKDHLQEKLKDEDFREKFLNLEGKTLGCWCKPEKCHGDVIVELLNEEIQREKIKKLLDDCRKLKNIFREMSRVINEL